MEWGLVIGQERACLLPASAYRFAGEGLYANSKCGICMAWHRSSCIWPEIVKVIYAAQLKAAVQNATRFNMLRSCRIYDRIHSSACCRLPTSGDANPSPGPGRSSVKTVVHTELWISWASLLRSYAAAHGLNSNNFAVIEFGEDQIVLRFGSRWTRFTHNQQQTSEGATTPSPSTKTEPYPRR